MTSHTSIIGHGRRKRGGFRWEQHGAPLDAFSRLACQSELELACGAWWGWGATCERVAWSRSAGRRRGNVNILNAPAGGPLQITDHTWLPQTKGAKTRTFQSRSKTDPTRYGVWTKKVDRELTSRPQGRGRAIQVYRYRSHLAAPLPLPPEAARCLPLPLDPTHSVTYRSIIVGATRNTDSKPRAAGRPFYRYLRRPRAGFPLPLHTRGSPTATAYPAPGADLALAKGEAASGFLFLTSPEGSAAAPGAAPAAFSDLKRL